MRRRIVLISFVVVAIVVTILATSRGQNLVWATFTRIRGRYTIADRLQQYGDTTRRRLTPFFDRAEVKYPPYIVAFLAIKEQRMLQVYAGRDEAKLQFITEYRIKGQSGDIGPKLREGDRQVPEGRYEIESLNPNSRFHLALRLDYPNDFDQFRGREDGRSNLGSDIMIHGVSASIGCLAMGDVVAEELFVLVADTGRTTDFVVITPVDFRTRLQWTAPPHLRPWVSHLYWQLRVEMRAFPVQNGPA